MIPGIQHKQNFGDKNKSNDSPDKTTCQKCKSRLKLKKQV